MSKRTVDATERRRLLALIFPDGHGGMVPLLSVDVRNPRAVADLLFERLRRPVDIGDHAAIVYAFRNVRADALDAELLALAADANYPLASRACALCAVPAGTMKAFGDRAIAAEDADAAEAFTYGLFMRWVDLFEAPWLAGFACSLMADATDDEQRARMVDDVEQARRVIGIPAVVLYADAIKDARLVAHRHEWLGSIANEGGPGAILMLARVGTSAGIDRAAHRDVVATMDRLFETIGSAGSVHPADGLAVFASHGGTALFRASVHMRRGLHFSVALRVAKARTKVDFGQAAAGPPWIEPELAAHVVPLRSVVNQAMTACVNRRRGRAIAHDVAVAFSVMDGTVPLGSPDWLPTRIAPTRLHVAR